MYEQGVSTIYNGAGSSGLGIITAAQNLNRYVTIGTNNQNELAPNNIMASAARCIDLYIEDAFKASLADTFEGGDFKISLKDNPNALQILYDGSNIEVPQDIKDKMDKVLEKLSGMDEDIPMDKSEIEDFLKKLGTFEQDFGQ
jgi:basic membrane protein A